MAFFEAYFDESGTHDAAPYTFVAGFIAKQSSWLSMSNQWDRVLKKFGVQACHATDLDNFKREFSEWSVDKRNSFVNSLFSVIDSESGLQSIGCGVEKGLFDRISAEYPDVRLTPYMLCAEYCCIYAGCIAKRKKHWPPVSIVFEAGPKHNSPTFNHFRVLLQSTQFREDHKINSIAWQNKKGMIPFQFSDMFVYELYKLHVARAKHGKLARIRHPLREFDKYVESKGKLLLEEDVREYYNLYQSFVRAHGAKYV